VYQFRLLDLADASTITPGTPVSGTLNPGNETDLYQFSANAGDKFYFDKQTLSGNSGNTEWRLLDPFERTVWSGFLGNDIGTQTLSSAGTYTLLIEGGINNTSPTSYGFNVQPVTNTTTALTLGAQVNGAITQTGQQNLYTFSLDNPTQLYFDSLTNDTTLSLSWTLNGPRGNEVNSRTFVGSDAGGFNSFQSPLISLGPGNYTLSVAANADSTGSYGFRLSDIAAASTITPGNVVSGTLNPGNATNLYKFDAQSGDPFYFDLQSLSGGGSTYWRLIDPAGKQLWFNNISDVGRQALAASGTYTLLVEGDIRNSSPVTYSFNAQKITDTITPLVLGTQINGAITQPGQQNSYTFSLANASQLYFDSLTNDTLSWSLSGPRGTEVTSRNFVSSDGSSISNNPVLSLVAGNYTLKVTAAFGDHVGSYSFRLSDLASGTQITPGNPISGSLASGNATDLYRLDAQAGDQIALNQQALILDATCAVERGLGE
jgi:hypothetical protein